MPDMLSNISNKKSDNIILDVKNLTKSFNKINVLENITFTLKKGEILGVIGPSGSGKTTLLRCIDLLETFENGEIIYNNIWKASYDNEGAIYINDLQINNNLLVDKQIIKIRQKMGFVFQNFNLWEDKTVIRNLTIGPIIVQKKSKKEATSEAIELASQFGLDDKINNKVWELSGGQKQRVAIIRALLMKPNMILLDEITSALDPVLTMDVLQAISKLRDKGLAMIVVTHHIEFASSLCDKMMFLSNGKIVQLDTPINLRSNPLTEEVSKFLYILKSTS